MNKLVLALGIVTMSFLGYSQNGLEKIIVEKYYVSTLADSIGSVGILPVGSTTYRVYVDMLPGYRFQTLYGNSDHPLKFSTTTSFFNNEDFGATTANAIKSVKLKSNTVAMNENDIAQIIRLSLNIIEEFLLFSCFLVSTTDSISVRFIFSSYYNDFDKISQP